MLTFPVSFAEASGFSSFSGSAFGLGWAGAARNSTLAGAGGVAVGAFVSCPFEGKAPRVRSEAVRVSVARLRDVTEFDFTSMVQQKGEGDLPSPFGLI
jgi:hypothetical protein